ncbi:hypothetical protein GGR56DRAFT_639750 [Xylariaceae sp. FL0804]|nr:hypothetical protein GGR56DRAFT_639750 [Xylariaceae sp. FL0804]
MRLSLRALSLPLLLLALPAAVRAVFQDEVGHVDWHHELLGVPQRETTFFHRPRPEEKASLLYTLSDLGVLGAVNPATGAIVWRHLLDDGNNNNNNVTDSGSGGHLRAADGEAWLASAHGRSVHAWDAMTGRNVWHLEFAGRVKDLEVMQMTEDEGGRKDVLALFEEDGTTVARRIHGLEGRVVWEFRETTGDLPLQVSTNIEKVFVVTLHGSLLSYSLKVVALDPLTGRKVDEIPLGTKGEVQKEEDVMFVGANSAAPIVAWTDNGRGKIRVNVLGTKSRQEFPLPPDTASVEVHAPHALQAVPHFLVHSRTDTGSKADVFHVDLKSSAISKAYELPLLEGSSAFSTSWTGANVYFTRVTPEEVVLMSSVSHGVLARWPLKEGARDPGAVHAVSDVVKKSGDSYAVRSAVVTDADDWVEIVNGDLAWTRPEGLSGAVAATWAEIPESEDLARTLEAEAHSNPLEAYVHRVTRHVRDLEYLPAYLQAVPERFLGSLFGSEPKTHGPLTRDSFGFNKLVVLATRRGKLYGLDAGNHGRIVWSKPASETPAPAGKPWDVRAIHADDAKGFVTVRGADGDFIIVRPDTGKTVESMPAGLFPPVDGAVVVDSDAGPWLLPINRGGGIAEMAGAWAPRQTVVTRTADGGLQGVAFESASSSAGGDGEQQQQAVVQVPVWTFTPPGGRQIVSVAARAAHDPIASIGRVLGDRSVKYKYLNPNTLVVAAVSDAAAAELSVYLLDTVSGQLLAASTHEGVDAGKEIGCVLAENWFLCTFFGDYALRDDASQTLKGYQAVVADLYESDLANDRGPLGDAANFSSLDPVDSVTTTPLLLPSVVSQTYVLPEPLAGGAGLAVTQTRQGITTRQVLAYLPESRAVVALPRALLEPRRPVGRDPNPQELEEGLGPRYAPLALDVLGDARTAVSHTRDVLLGGGGGGVGLGGKIGGGGGGPQIAVAPAVLESTCLVLAYGGVDVFGARVAPSMAFDMLGRGFNKLALVGTVLALTAGVGVLGPMVRKKQIDLRWKASM